MEDYAKDCMLKKIRDKLNADKIKLWVSPYTLPSGEKGEIPRELVCKLSEDLIISETEVEELIESLRKHALQKLSEREKFQKEGIATLRVKVTGGQPSEKQALAIEVDLNKDGSAFKALLSAKAGIPVLQLKLIASGRVIKDDIPLHDQDIKNGSQVMAVKLSVVEADAQHQEQQVSDVARTREAAELLTSRIDSGDDDDDYDIQIADQSGKPLQLPKEEKKALTLAMTLHEKGRAALKKKNNTQALLLFLEADSEFSKCQAELLKSVDNYAVLCLDIVWCYLILKNVDQLPDAEWRLQKSERCFTLSYGANNERLFAVKGGTGNEQALALFMKLHLLQGIVAFHQHKLTEASRLLNQAENELKTLQVDENLITEVMTMGFKEREARLALRACRGEIGPAVEHIMRRREEKKEINMKINEERKQKTRAKKMGKTANGEFVNVQFLDMLCTMGFPKGGAVEALRQSNNNMDMALEVLQNHSDLLSIPDPELEDIPITDDMIAQLTAMGFEVEMCRRALERHNSDVEMAMDDLVNSGGIIPPQPSTSRSQNSEKSARDKEREQRELDNLMSDISRDEEDYLDLSLKEESEILAQYRALVESVTS